MQMRSGALFMCAYWWNWFVSAIPVRNVARYALSSMLMSEKYVYASIGRPTRHESPFVSKKSCFVMSFGFLWCSLKLLSIVGPIIGQFWLLQVSAAQWNMPDKKSAVRIPRNVVRNTLKSGAFEKYGIDCWKTL